MNFLPPCVFLLVTLCCLLHVARAPPVTPKKTGEEVEEGNDVDEDLEYHRYLREVVSALESDPEFRAKLKVAEETDIRTGKIAQELDFVSHSVRTKLDEIKRQELDRLRRLASKELELTNDINAAHVKIQSQVEHLDHNNPHTFEIEDLKKLIRKTTDDLAEADRKRRDEFKEYEMQKEFEKQQKLQSLNEEHRKQYEKEMKDKEEKHKKHEPLHHPGSRDQLQEVWKEQDLMDSQSFDPHAFFVLHDVDSNGMWDETEVKALFRKELDKMYENGAPEDDMRERQEEMERMREHVFKEADTNGDRFISYDEFLIQTRRSEFEKDQGWKGLDEQQVYTPEEYHEFERRQLVEIQKMIDKGMIPPQPMYAGQQYPHVNDVHHPQAGYPPHPGQPQFQQPMGQAQYPPQGGQPQYQQQYNPQPPHPNAVPQGQFQQPHPNLQQGQYPQGQIPHPQTQGQHPQPQMQQSQGQMQQPQGQAKNTQGQMQQPQGQMQHPPQMQQQNQGQGHQPQNQHQGQAQQPQGQVHQAQGQVNQQAQQSHDQQNSQPQNQQPQNQQPQGDNNHPNAIEHNNV